MGSGSYWEDCGGLGTSCSDADQQAHPFVEGSAAVVIIGLQETNNGQPNGTEEAIIE